MTIVKVQRPLAMPPQKRWDAQLSCWAPQPPVSTIWLIYDQLQARVEYCPQAEVRADILTLMDLHRGTPRFAKTYWDNAFWDDIEQKWDLTKATEIQPRRW